MRGQTCAAAFAVAAAMLVAGGCTQPGAVSLVVGPDLQSIVHYVEVAVARPQREDVGCEELIDRATPPFDRLTSLDGFDIVKTLGLRFGPTCSDGSLGQLDEGVLVAARARGVDCVVVAQGCAPIDYEALALGQEVRIELPATDPSTTEPIDCPVEGECRHGQCGTETLCCTDFDCSDDNPWTTDVCNDESCGIAVDLDRDGFQPPEDCDDRNPEACPECQVQCGRGADHDCDGRIDDVVQCANLPPTCENPELRLVALLPELATWAVATSGSLVFLATLGHGAAPPVRLWVGELSGDGSTLIEHGGVDLPGTNRRRPADLDVLGSRALVTTTTGRTAVVDRSDPSNPRYEGEISLEGTLGMVQMVEVAPPVLLLLGVQTDGVRVYDATRADPTQGWPQFMASTGPDGAGPGLALSSVGFWSFHMNTSGNHIYCVDLAVPAIPRIVGEEEGYCLSVASAWLGVLGRSSTDVQAEALLVLPGTEGAPGEVLLEVLDRNASEGEVRSMWRLPFTEDGPGDLGSILSPFDARGPTPLCSSPDPGGEPRPEDDQVNHLLVVQGLIVRSSREGVQVFRLDDIGPAQGCGLVDLAHWEGYEARRSAIAGRTLLVALEESGLAMLELACGE